jgi:hypothetical protein
MGSKGGFILILNAPMNLIALRSCVWIPVNFRTEPSQSQREAVKVIMLQSSCTRYDEDKICGLWEVWNAYKVPPLWIPAHNWEENGSYRTWMCGMVSTGSGYWPVVSSFLRELSGDMKRRKFLHPLRRTLLLSATRTPQYAGNKHI